MFRNQYDTDVTTFSPQGRLHQVEYAMEAVKQGSAVVGLKSDKAVVLLALRRSTASAANTSSSSDAAETPVDPGSYQKKVFRVDEHFGVGVSGLIADARALVQYMRNEALNHQFLFGNDVQIGRLVTQISDKSQVYTQKQEKRPYGVGLLVAGVDKTGTHLYETSPNGVHFEYIAQAIGARSQSAKTYLERVFETLAAADDDTLIRQGLKALKGTSPSGELTALTVSIAIVTLDKPFATLTTEQVEAHLQAIRDESGNNAMAQ